MYLNQFDINLGDNKQFNYQSCSSHYIYKLTKPNLMCPNINIILLLNKLGLVVIKQNLFISAVLVCTFNRFHNQ